MRDIVVPYRTAATHRSRRVTCRVIDGADYRLRETGRDRKRRDQSGPKNSIHALYFIALDFWLNLGRFRTSLEVLFSGETADFKLAFGPMQETSLLASARIGDVAAVEQLLQAGADPSLQDSSGRTALHYAVASRDAQMAACLLTYGADHRITDNDGVPALDAQYVPIEFLHHVRQRHRRFYSRGCNGDATDVVHKYAKELDRAGLVKVSGVMTDDTLAQMQSDFRRFIMELKVRVSRGGGTYSHYDEELHWRVDDQAFLTNNAFKYSATLARLCCHPTISGIANLYLGQPAYIQRGVGMRYFPAEGIDREMYAWHHDIEEQRVKMMILLTDVGENDQYMSYIAGSQKLYHPYAMFHDNVCTPDYCREHLGELEILKTIGQAGDVFLFDSNGAHRGNRFGNAAVRDAFFIEYTVDRCGTWGGDIKSKWFEGIDFNGRPNPFERMLTATKKWDQPMTRKETDWVINLPHLETWV